VLAAITDLQILAVLLMKLYYTSTAHYHVDITLAGMGRKKAHSNWRITC